MRTGSQKCHLLVVSKLFTEYSKLKQLEEAKEFHFLTGT